MPVFSQKRPLRKERRAQARGVVDVPAEMVGAAARLHGRVESICGAGAAFVSRGEEQPFALGDVVTLRLTGDRGADGEFSLRGRIVRAESLCDETGDSTLWAVALDQYDD